MFPKQVHPERRSATMELPHFIDRQGRLRMQLKTILNRVERHKSFVYGEPRWVDDALRLTIEVPIEPRANGRPDLLGLREAAARLRPLTPTAFRVRAAVADRRGVRLRPAARRLPTLRRGGRTGSLVDGKSRLTTTYQWFLAGWAGRLSWKEVASVFHTTWEHVRDSVRHAVGLGPGASRFVGRRKPSASTRSSGDAAITT